MRDKNNKDKNTFVDIIARADDALKIQRIIDRFDLATVDKGTIVSQSEKAIEERKKKAEEKTDKSENNELFDKIFAEDNSEKSADESEHKPIQRENPFTPQTEKSPPSENGSIGESTLSNEGTVVKDKKPSVREKLNEYRRQIKQQKEQDKQTPVVYKKPKADKKPAVTERQQSKPIKNKKPKER